MHWVRANTVILSLCYYSCKYLGLCSVLLCFACISDHASTFFKSVLTSQPLLCFALLSSHFQAKPTHSLHTTTDVTA